jgi:fluoroquinolone resistance protein
MSMKASNLGSVIESKAYYANEVFKEVQLAHTEVVSSEFYDCVFSHSTFAESVFRGCRFINCVFRDCDLSLVKVAESRFASTRFENSRVIGVNWTEAHWPKAGVANPLSFSKCAISHSTFIGLSLQSMELRDCVASDVDFREADLSLADFGATDLSGSLFSKTNLSGADLSRALNYSIDPGQNALKRAKFSLPEAMSLLHTMDIVLVDQD